MEYLTLEEHSFITLDCAQCGHTHRALQPCGLRFCPVCSIKRRIRVRNYLHELFRIVHQRPGQRLKMLTLSCQNTGDLRKGVDHLVKSFRKLRNRKFWNKYVSGGIAIIEIKGRPGNYHPHLHVLLYAKFLPWNEIRHHWERVSSGTAVWISNIPKGKAIYYVTKYVTKLDMPDEAQEEPNEAMHGRHLFMKFGDWSQVKPLTREFLFTCTICGASDWIDEFTLRRCQRK